VSLQEQFIERHAKPRQRMWKPLAEETKIDTITRSRFGTLARYQATLKCIEVPILGRTH
jgi:hypothetical protein